MFVVKLATSLVILQLNSISINAKPSNVSIPMPTVCEGKNYCFEKPLDYPQQVFEELWTELNLRAVDPDNEVEQRSGDDGFEKVCEKNTTLLPIYQIIDEEGNMRYVAQIEKKFIQKLEIIECVNPGRVQYGLDLFNDWELQNFNVQCVETRLHHKFLVLSHDRRRVELAGAMGGIPVCCSCRYNKL